MASPVNLRVWMENRMPDIRDEVPLKDPPAEIKTWAQEQRDQNKKIVCVHSSKLTADSQAMVEELSQKDGYAVMVIDTSSSVEYKEEGKIVATSVNESIQEADIILNGSSYKINTPTIEEILTKVNKVAKNNKDKWLTKKVYEEIAKFYLEESSVDSAVLEESLRAIGANMKDDALVVMDIALMPGATEKLITPILNKERKARNLKKSLLLVSTSKLTQGLTTSKPTSKKLPYIYSGINSKSNRVAKAFFKATQEGKLTQVSTPTTCEMLGAFQAYWLAAKTATVTEFGPIAEALGADVHKILEAIRERPTHKNFDDFVLDGNDRLLLEAMILSYKGAERFNFMDKKNFVMLPPTVSTMILRPLHAIQLAEKGLTKNGKSFKDLKKVVILGASGRSSSIIQQALLNEGVVPESIKIHDESNVDKLIEGAELVILGATQKKYSGLSDVISKETDLTVVDCCNALNDSEIAQIAKNDSIQVLGFGKGHVDELKSSLISPPPRGKIQKAEAKPKEFWQDVYKKGVSRDPFEKTYDLPTAKSAEKEVEETRQWVAEQRTHTFINEKGEVEPRRIVNVQGLGFVGAVMALVCADAKDKNGNLIYGVIGLQRPSSRSYWKIDWFNKGKSPIESADPDVQKLLTQAYKQKNIRATYVDESLGEADIIIADIQLEPDKPGVADKLKEIVQKVNSDDWFSADIMGMIADFYRDQGGKKDRAFKDAMHTIGHYMKEGALVVIETTVPPGTTELVVKPIIDAELKVRELATKKYTLTHSYERVMPGAKYVWSIQGFARVFSGVDHKSMEKGKKELLQILNLVEYKDGMILEEIKKMTLRGLNRTHASELAKVFENFLRAGILASPAEFGIYCEKAGVNIWEIIEIIRLFPGFEMILGPDIGVGGYCLTKDLILAWVAAVEYFGMERANFLLAAIILALNDFRPLHAIQLAQDGLNELNGKKIEEAVFAILGGSYLLDVGDTRYSPSKTLVDALRAAGVAIGNIWVHDPFVLVWPEMEEDGIDIELHGIKDGESVYDSLGKHHADVIYVAKDHEPYVEIDPRKVYKVRGNKPAVIVDAYHVLTDEQIKGFLQLGFVVRGYGKGHIPRLKKEVEAANTLANTKSHSKKI